MITIAAISPFRSTISYVKRSLLAACLFLGISNTFAQTYTFPDVNLRNAMLKKHPFLMTGNDLNITAATSYTGALDLDSANITNASGIHYFRQATSINLNVNKLTTIPSLTGSYNLQYLYLNNNQITSLPDLSALSNLEELQVSYNPISTLPASLSTLTNLIRLYAMSCQLTSLPSLSGLTNLQIIIVSLNANLGALPDLSTLVNLRELHANRTGIDTIPGLSSLVNLEQLHVWENNIRNISGINSGGKLIMLLVQDNPLQKLPNLAPFINLKQLHVNNTGIDTIPGLASLVNLEELHCTGNKIRDLSAVNGNTKLNRLVAGDNLLTRLPVLSNKSWFYSLEVKRNRLTFEDVLPLTSMFWFNSFVYSPQQMVGAEETLYIQKGQPLQLDLNIDLNVTTNWYKWYKNGVLLDSNQTGSRSFSSVDFSDAGVYHVVVSNPSLPKLTLTSYPWTVKVTNCEGCGAVFSPNGDGVLDFYKIEESGTARIYDLSGALIKEFMVPGEWDGTKSNGSMADAGYYAVVINGKKVINVSLVR